MNKRSRILKKYVNDYNQLKGKMEKLGEKYGLTDQRTIELSQKLDSLLNELMMFRYPGLNKQKRLG